MRLLRKILLTLFLAGVLLAAAFTLVWHMANRPLVLGQPAIQVLVPPGASLRMAAERIAAAGVPVPAWLLAGLGRVQGVDRRMHSGTYRFADGATPVEILDKLARGDIVTTRVTLVEGKTLREYRALLDARDDLTHELHALDDATLAARLGQPNQALEGRLLPETYVVPLNASDFSVIQTAHQALRETLASAWAARAADSPLQSADQLLVLASIVEKESGEPGDRAHIARVFVNRLRIGMPLQSDPTVIYGIGARFDGNLRRVDLTTDTPWNTYTRSGLPPTPIAAPGRDAILAAANPPPGKDLYFVARGDGSSEFSATLDAHNRAVAKYQRGGRSG